MDDQVIEPCLLDCVGYAVLGIDLNLGDASRYNSVAYFSNFKVVRQDLLQAHVDLMHVTDSKFDHTC
jgi:predicted nicotinamide N-methyase